MDEAGVRALLLKRAKKYARNVGTSGVTPWCEAHGITKSHVNEWLNGKESPPAKVLDALGLQVSYTKKKGPDHG